MKIFPWTLALALIPTAASADPITATIVAVVTSQAFLTAVAGALVSLAVGLVSSLLAPQRPAREQQKSRTREFNPLPPFRAAFGEFPLEGSVVWHKVDGKSYYMVLLLNSWPSEEIYRVDINEELTLEFDDIANALDFSGGGALATGPYPWNLKSDSWADLRMWFGMGDQTSPPDWWLNGAASGSLGDYKIKAQSDLLSTDAWTGCTVAFVWFEYGGTGTTQKRYSKGTPPPLKFYGKWSKLYDPRKDSTSGVTQFGATSPTPSPEHDRYDPSTWEYSPNAALCALHLAREQKALGFDDEMIPIQQWADAADACGEEVVAISTVIDLDNTVNVGTSAAAGFAAGITVSGFNASEIVTVTLPVGQTFVAYSPWGTPAYSGNNTGSWNRVYVAKDGDHTNAELLGAPHPTNIDSSWDGYEAARAAFPRTYLSGASSYTFYFTDPVIGDNTGGLSIKLESTGNPKFRCDGVVTIEQRELSLLSPALDCMAGTLDTTDGMLGVRAGVWEEPTHTMSQPLRADIQILGARDSGFDKVRAKYIGRERDWTEADGPGYALRAGNREHALELPLVRESAQAGRLEKIFGGRAEPNRTIIATWDGSEASRRLGERVNFALEGFARSSSTYTIEDKAPTVAEDEDGLRVEFQYKLVEDVAETYDFDQDEDYSEQDAFTPPTVTVSELGEPQSVTITQSNYRTSAGTFARLLITITPPADLTTEPDWFDIQVNDGGSYFSIPEINYESGEMSFSAYYGPVDEPLTYAVRARSAKSDGTTSDWTTSNSLLITTPVLDYSAADYSVEYA